jgi:hypothetical protein
VNPDAGALNGNTNTYDKSTAFTAQTNQFLYTNTPPDLSAGGQIFIAFHTNAYPSGSGGIIQYGINAPTVGKLMCGLGRKTNSDTSVLYHRGNGQTTQVVTANGVSIGHASTAHTAMLAVVTSGGNTTIEAYIDGASTPQQTSGVHTSAVLDTGFLAIGKCWFTSETLLHGEIDECVIRNTYGSPATDASAIHNAWINNRSILVSLPTNAQTIIAGDDATVSFTTHNSVGRTYNVKLSVDGGQSFSSTLSTGISSGSTEITIPSSVSASSQCIIRVEEEGNTGVFCDSEIFSVVANTNTSPTISITNEANTYIQGSSNAITATATDVEDGDLTDSIIWSSDIQSGTLAIGGTLDTAVMNVGIHTLTATVIDAGGLSSSDTIQITITEPQIPPATTIKRTGMGINVNVTGDPSNPDNWQVIYDSEQDRNTCGTPFKTVWFKVTGTTGVNIHICGIHDVDGTRLFESHEPDGVEHERTAYRGDIGLITRIEVNAAVVGGKISWGPKSA